MFWKRLIPCRGFLSAISVGIWLALVFSGSMILIHYASQPGVMMDAASSWPDNAQLTRSTIHPTLIMFAHPHCSCTRASVDELANIAYECQGSVDILIVFFCPNQSDASWQDTRLVRQAKRIPKAAIAFDCNAHESQRFRATISGQVMLFSPTGKLWFNGGITVSRGHAGESYGKSEVIALLRSSHQTNRGTNDPQRFPTFGCMLVAPEFVSEALNR